MTAFFGRTSFIMFKNSYLSLSMEEYTDINCKYHQERERLFMLRIFKNGKDFFQFQHKYFYEYFIIHHAIFNLINNNNNNNDQFSLLLDDRKKFFGINNFYQNHETQLRRCLYNLFLNDEQVREFFIKIIKTSFVRLETEDIIIVDDPIWFIDRIILLLPLIRTLKYRKFQINGIDELEEYVNNRFIELNNEALIDSKGADRFGKIFILDMTKGIFKTEVIEYFGKIDEVRILIKNMNEFYKCLCINNINKIKLLVDTHLSDLPELVEKIVNENIKWQRFSFLNTIKFYDIDGVLNIIRNKNLDKNKIVMNELIFIEQLHYIETYYSGFNNIDTNSLIEKFSDIFVQYHVLIENCLNEL